MGSQAKLRPLLYNRVSHDARGNKRSVEEQETEGRRVCRHEGWKIRESLVFNDNDIGASRYSKGQRPAWQQVCDAIADGLADVLVVWEVSRTTRDRVVWAALVETCIEHNVRICVGGKSHDLSDPDDAFMLDLQALLGVREVGVTRKRILRALNANAEAGRPHGPLLYGYARVYDTNGHYVEQIIDPVTGPIVKDIVKRFLRGESLNSIATYLRGADIPPPRPEWGQARVRPAEPTTWTASTILRLLKRASYAGYRVHRGQIVGKGNWPALITPADFEKVQARLAAPGRRTQFDNRVKWLLSGIAQCAICDRTMRVRKNRGVPVYNCPDNHIARRVEPVDLLVTEALLARLSQPDALDLLREGAADDSDRLNVSAEVATLRDRLAEYQDKAVAGAITAEGYATIERKLLDQIESLEGQRRAYVDPVLREFVGADVVEVWERMTLNEKRSTLRALMQITILKGTASHKFDPSLVLLRFR